MKNGFVWCAVALAAGALAVRPVDARGRDAHILVLDGNAYSTNVDIEELVRIRQGRTGDFLWFVRGGRAYVVTDPETLAAGRTILGPVQALSREQEAMSARLRPFEERADDLDREEERLEERFERLEGRDDRAAEEERGRLDVLQRALDERQRQAQVDLRPLEAEEQRLEDREGAVEAVADAQIAQLVEDVLRRGLARPAR